MKAFVKRFYNGPVSISSSIEFLVRMWLGYIMIINSVVGVTIPLEDLGLPPDAYLFIKSLWDTGYLMHLTKLIELICGLLLVLNLFVPLALIILMPVLINILGIGYFVLHSIRLSLPLTVAALILIYFYRKAYRPLLHYTAST
jgi:putative oxidoreductase